MERRNKIEIVHDILLAIREKGPEAKPTHVLYKSNLSYVILNENLKKLIGDGLVLELRKSDKRTLSLTDKGFKFLEEYEVMKTFINSYGL